MLVDTSVWVDFLRGRRGVHVTALAALLESDAVVCMTPTVLQEVLQGASTREYQAALERRFRSMPLLGFRDSTAGAIGAARLYLACRLAGATPRAANDCLIAHAAIEHGVPLLHHDRDFDAIATVEARLRLFPIAGASP